MGMLQVEQLAELRAIIRLKVAAGILPKDAPVRMWAGYGTGKVCAACALSTTMKDIEYEVDMANRQTFVFHQSCLTLWSVRRTSNRSSAIVARRYPRLMTGPPQKGTCTMREITALAPRRSRSKSAGSV
jgi:hypothetical protein